MTDLEKVVISLAIEQARKEGLTDEMEISTRANEIARDAVLEEPTTILGQMINGQANQIIKDQANGVESPYFPKPQYDMNALYAKTVNASIKPVLEIISKYSEVMGRQLVAPTKESDIARREALDNITLGMFKILNENKVPLKWYPEMFGDLKEIIMEIDSFMKDQVQGHTKEIISRVVGARHPNPDVNTFNSDFATYEQLIESLAVVKKQTGGKDEDYGPKKQDTLDIG